MSEIPPVTQTEDTSTIRAMREQLSSSAEALKAAEKEKAELETRLKELERAKLDETERLRLEREDLQRKIQDLEPEVAQTRDRLGRYESSYERMYKEELEKVTDPATKERLERMSSRGDWTERLEILRDGLALRGDAPVQEGGRSNPGGGPPAGSTPNQIDPKEVKNLSWTAALGK